MRAIVSDGPIPTAIWLCAGDNKPANATSPVYKGGLTVRLLLCLFNNNSHYCADAL
jgi:hypothetical protein